MQTIRELTPSYKTALLVSSNFFLFNLSSFAVISKLFLTSKPSFRKFISELIIFIDSVLLFIIKKSYLHYRIILYKSKHNKRRYVIIRVNVRDNNLEKAMRAMKKKLQREGIFKEMKQRRAYEKPSEKKARLLNECTRRYKKMLRKKIEIQGY